MITPRIRLVRPVGRGGMGTVWAAYHETLKTEVAVKLVHGDKSQHATARARFAREAAIAAKLKSPHVTPTYDHGALADGTPYIVMELLEGESLASRLKRGPLSLDETARIIAQVAQVLGKAHRLNIIHRDVKPGNLFLLDSDYELFVKMFDFGTAKAQASCATMALTRPGHMVGSPRYMSPEQLSTPQEVDHRADLWALAVVAYRCLTTVPPFNGSTLADTVMAILEQNYQPITVARPMLPKPLDSWFAKAFHANLPERFQDAKALASSLMEITRTATGPSKQAAAHPSIADLAYASFDSPPQNKHTTAQPPPYTPPAVDITAEQPTQQLPAGLQEQSCETATFSPAAATVARTSAKSRTGTLIAMLAVLSLGAIGGYALSLPAGTSQTAPGLLQGQQSDRTSPFQEDKKSSTTRLKMEQALELHQPRPSTASASAAGMTAAVTAPMQIVSAPAISATATTPMQRVSAPAISATTTAAAQIAPRRTSSAANIPTPKPVPSTAATSSASASDAPVPRAAPIMDYGF